MCPHTCYYMCVLRTMAFFCFFVGASSLNISDRGCASLTLAGIASDTDVCVRVCVCECVRERVCVEVYSLSVCVSGLPGCFGCVIYLFLRGTKYVSVLVLLYC
jgi:hypothetical protein